jgi:hypothetical protein
MVFKYCILAGISLFAALAMARMANADEYTKDDLQKHCSQQGQCCDKAVSVVLNKKGSHPTSLASECPLGFQMQTLLCQGGFTWCEAVKEAK